MIGISILLFLSCGFPLCLENLPSGQPNGTPDQPRKPDPLPALIRHLQFSKPIALARHWIDARQLRFGKSIRRDDARIDERADLQVGLVAFRRTFEAERGERGGVGGEERGGVGFRVARGNLGDDRVGGGGDVAVRGGLDVVCRGGCVG